MSLKGTWRSTPDICSLCVLDQYLIAFLEVQFLSEAAFEIAEFEVTGAADERDYLSLEIALLDFAE